MEIFAYQATGENTDSKMNLLFRIRRKIYKVLHPAIGEVWMLHSVCRDGEQELNDSTLEISASTLDGIIRQKKEKGYKFISLNDLYKIYSRETKVRKFICITLDDGYENNYSVAYPILRKYSCPFAIAITTGLCDGSVKPWWCDNVKFLSYEQIREMSRDSLCTISAHTVSHPRLSTLPYSEQKKEITESIRQLEQIIGKRIEHFAYPHGDFNDDTLSILKELGIKTAVKVNGGFVRRGQCCDMIPRIVLK